MPAKKCQDEQARNPCSSEQSHPGSGHPAGFWGNFGKRQTEERDAYQEFGNRQRVSLRHRA